eukprot:9158773-Heterocapsa_arctica.AAC.1
MPGYIPVSCPRHLRFHTLFHTRDFMPVSSRSCPGPYPVSYLWFHTIPVVSYHTCGFIPRTIPGFMLVSCPRTIP